MAAFELHNFLASLPEIKTARLPQGTLFYANEVIYQVIEARGGGLHKARQWRSDESTDVALVPGSYFANFLPVVERGHLLPVFPARTDMLHNGDAQVFLFPDEQQALDAAYLDVALVQSGGAYVRNHGREPGFAATDGVHVYRVYYYSRSVQGHSTLGDFAKQKTLQFIPYYRGPNYWRLLPSWRAPYISDDTIPNANL